MFGKKSTLSLTLVAVVATAVILFGVVAQAADSIAIHFGADEPDGRMGSMLAADEVAGVPDVETANWNNTSGASGTLRNLIRDTEGDAKETEAVVQWLTTNTWSSTGRGEENNNFTGANRKLMLGYLDQNADGVTTEVLITGLPDDLAESYDVYVYFLGGVPGRGGAYNVNGVRKFGTVGGNTGCGDDGMAPCNGPDFVEDPGDDHTTRGNYLYFPGLKGSRVTITAMNDFGETPRAAINGIQIGSAP
jgi:hypothetical protein